MSDYRLAIKIAGELDGTAQRQCKAARFRLLPGRVLLFLFSARLTGFLRFPAILRRRLPRGRVLGIRRLPVVGQVQQMDVQPVQIHRRSGGKPAQDERGSGQHGR